MTGLPVVDLLLAGVLLAWSVLGEVGLSGPGRPAASLATVVWVGALALRTTAPFAMAVVAAAGAVWFALVPQAPDAAPFEASLVIAFSLGSRLANVRLWTASLLYLGAVALLGASTTRGQSVVHEVGSALVVVLGPVAVGVAVRRSAAQTAELRRLRDTLTAEQDARARDAAAAERNRIARDLHDLIAHSVSVMVVQAGAAEAQLPSGSPARAQLLAVRRTGQETLAELRRQLGLLRDGP